MDDLNLDLGQTFKTFAEFQAMLARRSQMMNEKMVIGRSSRTVASANAKLNGPFRYSADLVYTNVKFRCVHEGSFTSRGQSRETTSLRNGCPVHVKLCADKVSNTLRISSLDLQHNHMLPQKEDGVYATDRRLNNNEAAEVKKLIDLGAPVANIQGHVSSSYGKHIKLKDLHNMRTKKKDVDGGGLEVEDQVWQVLNDMVQKDPGSHYSVLADGDQVTAIFLQTSSMKKLLVSYPDVLYIDCTYCLNVLGYPVVVFMVVDGNNVGRCVGYACVKDERMVTLAALFGEFVRKNEGVEVKTVVVDKDASEIGALKQAMPWADVLLCRFHVSRSLGDAVRKYCAKVDQEVMSELVCKMLWCDKEEDFWSAYESVNGHLKVYLQKNWIPIRASWANFCTKGMKTWGNKTNNFVERHNRVLKTLASSKTSLPELFRSLLAYHRREESKVRQSAKELVLKSRVLRPQFAAANDLLSAASATFTPYACNQLKAQIDKLQRQEVTYDAERKSLAVTKSGVCTMYQVDGGCKCLYHLEKSLPCWHMLAYYRGEGLDPLQYIPERYKKSMLLECVESETVVVNEPEAVRQVNVVSRKVEKSEWEKGMLMKEVCRELVSVGVRCGMTEFERRLSVLKSLVYAWRTGENVEVPDRLNYGDDVVQVLDEDAQQDVNILASLLIEGCETESEYAMRENLDQTERCLDVFDSDENVDECVQVMDSSENVESAVQGDECVQVMDSRENVESAVQGDECVKVMDSRENVESAVQGDECVQVMDSRENVESAVQGDEYVQVMDSRENVESAVQGDECVQVMDSRENVESAVQGDECVQVMDRVNDMSVGVYGDGYRVIQRVEGRCNLKFDKGKSKGRPKGDGVSSSRIGRKRKGKTVVCKLKKVTLLHKGEVQSQSEPVDVSGLRENVEQEMSEEMSCVNVLHVEENAEQELCGGGTACLQIEENVEPEMCEERIVQGKEERVDTAEIRENGRKRKGKTVVCKLKKAKLLHKNEVQSERVDVSRMRENAEREVSEEMSCVNVLQVEENAEQELCGGGTACLQIEENIEPEMCEESIVQGRVDTAEIRENAEQEVKCRKAAKKVRFCLPVEDEEVCQLCGNVELDKDFCDSGAYMDWVDCDVCEKWFHCYCISHSKSVSSYVCVLCSKKSKLKRKKSKV